MSDITAQDLAAAGFGSDPDFDAPADAVQGLSGRARFLLGYYYESYPAYLTPANGAKTATAGIPGTWGPTTGTRSVSDGVTNATTTVTSATAVFTSADVGKAISGGTIPGGATIASVTNATTVVISAAATGSGSGVTLTIGTPVQATPPSNVANLIAGIPYKVTASPATLWTTGQYVQTGTAGAPGQAHWTGTAWATAPALREAKGKGKKAKNGDDVDQEPEAAPEAEPTEAEPTEDQPTEDQPETEAEQPEG